MELKYNRLHKNGWVSFKIAGVAGAVFIDKRMFEGELPGEGSTIQVEGVTFKPAGAGATEQDAAKVAAKLEKENQRAVKAAAAAEKAQARLAKLQEQSDRATKAVEAAKAKAAGSGAESTGDVASL